MKKVCSFVLAAAIGLAGCLLLPTKVLAKKGDKHFAQGLQYEAARQWEKAIEEFALAVAADPSKLEYQIHFRRAKFNVSQMYVLQGRALSEQRDFLRAYNAFKQAYGFDPENALIVSEMDRVLKIQSETERTNGSAKANVAKTGELPESGSQSAAQAQKAPSVPPRTEQSRVIGYSGDLFNSERAKDRGVTVSGTATGQTGAVIPSEKLSLVNENLTLVDKETTEIRKTISDGAGHSSFARNPSREYLLKGEAEGFDSARLPISVTDKPQVVVNPREVPPEWPKSGADAVDQGGNLRHEPPIQGQPVLNNSLPSADRGMKGPSPTAVKGTPAQNGQNGRPGMEIRRVSRAPKLEDFLDMQPNSELAPQLAKVDSFIQRNPKDGSPSSQRTEVYLGYDDKNFYSIFVCFDNEPKSVRARMVRREDISGDDAVELMLDTFNDQRRAYAFRANPFGIQLDALFTEGSKDEEAEREGFDPSYDTLWYSSGKLTDRGYVVWMAIPFRSLRFSSKELQHWGILLNRDIPRLNEEAFWPQYSNRIEGRLNQMATADGLQKISPGRNMQFIPYGIFRSARSLDTRDPEMPGFRKRTQVDGGLDAKFGIKDSMVLDVAVNPDFNQVESDEPQVTVTERFEVEFPEKRPFFLENANYFQTPLKLVFTRRIVDPQVGGRITGKLGPYALGAFVIDDQAPGKRVLPDDPLHGKRALFGIFRVNRDIFEQSTIGLLYTDREFANSHNRVFGVDGRFKLGENWVAGFQAAMSRTRFLDGSNTSGTAYNATLSRSGRSLAYDFAYKSFSPDFHTEAGFVERTDIHDFKQTVEYRFRPEGKYLISWGPRVATQGVFDHSGLRLDFTQNNSISFELIGNTEFGFEYNLDRERLRPKDFPVLQENRDFHRNEKQFFFNTSYFDWFTFEGSHGWGQLINFDPPEDHEPFLTNATQSEFLLTLRPRTNLRVDNTYLLTRLHDQLSKANVLTNHIIRSKWNYQFSRELSLRVILQYDSILTNPEFTSEEIQKNFNADFLLTYLINPWTALYVGYNNNRQNIALVPTDSGAEIVRRRNQFINDGRQFFVKFSYLFRF